MQKIGLFFGTFNPIHNGHLKIAEFFTNKKDIDSVWFVITPKNPFKNNFEMLSNECRFELVSRAISNIPKLEISTVEFDLPKPNYTYRTLEKLKLDYPKKKFILLLGEDNMTLFNHWKDYNKILDNYELYIYPRKTNRIIDKNLQKHPKINWVNSPKIEISSSMIRDNIKLGIDMSQSIPKKSWFYIGVINVVLK